MEVMENLQCPIKFGSKYNLNKTEHIKNPAGTEYWYLWLNIMKKSKLKSKLDGIKILFNLLMV